MVVHGRAVKIYKTGGGALVALSHNCELTMDVAVKEVSTPQMTTSRQYIAGRKEWSLMLSYLIADRYDDLLLEPGQTYDVKIQVDGSDKYMEGRVLVSTCKITGSRGTLAQGSFEFQGCGELTTIEV